MKNVMKLAAILEACRKSLFNQGFTFSEADEMTRLTFCETGLIWNEFFELDKEEILSAISHMEENILNA